MVPFYDHRLIVSGYTLEARVLLIEAPSPSPSLSTLITRRIRSLSIIEVRLCRGMVTELFGSVSPHLADVRNQPSFEALDD